jgi:hypothetical protein
LPLVDMMFSNPPCHATDTGFWHGASRRVIEMLLARDVSTRS